MRAVVSTMLLATIAGAMLACAAEPESSPAPQPAIVLPADLTDVLRAYERAYAARDSAALAALFAADGFLLRPGAPVQRGGATVSATLAAEGGALALVPLAFERGDSAGFIIGTFGAEAGPTRGGKFILALTRRAPGAGGAWRIVADMDSPNAR